MLAPRFFSEVIFPTIFDSQDIKHNSVLTAIAKAILKNYDIENVQDMQDAIKDVFGNMFEAMLQGEMNSHRGYKSNSKDLKETAN